MFKKYYPPPAINGRNLFIKNLIKEKGKKHYWGEPGRDYGFYTYEEQKEIVCHWNQTHRRANSNSYPHIAKIQQNINQPVKKNSAKIYSSLSQRINTQPAYAQPCTHFQGDINYRNSPQMQNQQMANKINRQNQEKTLASKIKIGKMNNKHQRVLTLTKNIDICLPKIERKRITQQVKQKKEVQNQEFLSKNAHVHNRSKTKDASQMEYDNGYRQKIYHEKVMDKRRKSHIFRMQPKLDRSYSPTYCNSINYPLSYFRHIK